MATPVRGLLRLPQLCAETGSRLEEPSITYVNFGDFCKDSVLKDAKLMQIVTSAHFVEFMHLRRLDTGNGGLLFEGAPEDVFSSRTSPTTTRM